MTHERPAAMPTAAARTMIAAVATLAVLLLASAFVVPSPAAAACGTNWTSKKEPPPTIRVLRTQTGRVEKVDFKRYVVVVMASGEWPTTMPKALLEAGVFFRNEDGMSMNPDLRARCLKRLNPMVR